jgi:hypothetical protein
MRWLLLLIAITALPVFAGPPGKVPYRPRTAAAGGGGGGGTLTFDAAGGSAGSGTTLTFSHTCTGADRILFVGVSWQGNGITISSVTYNGVAMSELWDVAHSSLGAYHSGGLILANPATGANDVVITFSGSADLSSAGSVSFTDADTSSPNRTAVTADGSSTTASVNASDAVSGDIVVDAATCALNAIAVGADQTSRYEDDAILGSNQSLSVSTQPGASGGVMTATFADGTWVTGAVALKRKP